MSVNIHIEKKDLWLLAAIGIFLVGVAYVIAWTYPGQTANPAIHGHTADEIEGGGGTNNLVLVPIYSDRGGSFLVEDNTNPIISCYTNCTINSIEYNLTCVFYTENGVPKIKADDKISTAPFSRFNSSSSVDEECSIQWGMYWDPQQQEFVGYIYFIRGAIKESGIINCRCEIPIPNVKYKIA